MAETLHKSSARGLLIVFALSVFVPAIVLAVLAYGSVARERRALTAERAGALAAVGARVKRDLADALEKVRRAEEERPWFHYNTLFFEPGQVGKGLSYQPSPLAMGNGNPLIETWSHFQIDPAGTVSSPTPHSQVPAQTMQVRRNAQIAVSGKREHEQQVAAIRDGIQQSNDLLSKVQDKLLPQAKQWQAQVQQDGKGQFPGSTDNNLSQLTNRKGTIANQQSEQTVREIIEGKKKRLDETNEKPEEEILSVEVSVLNFTSLPDVGILAYRFVDAPNETRSYEGQPVLRYVQGFKLDLDYVRNTLFPSFVDRELDDVHGAAVALLPENTRAGDRLAYEESVPLLPGYRIVVTDSDPKWVAERVQRLSMLLIGAAGLLLLVIAGGLGFTLRTVKHTMELADRKSDFVAAVTHELRTPLTGIKMYADMLKAGWVKDESTRDEYVGFMAAETDRLARLVNRVLDFARTDRGRAEVEPVDLAAPVREVVRDFGPYIREKGFVLSVRHETKRAATANSDGVKQILLNLLENAVKYAAGAKEKTIGVVVADAGDRIALSVIDHGPGVPEAERDRIFTDFYRPGEELTRETPGAGLGLALVRRLAESMGGMAEVRETPGGGATFRVTLPTGA